jgi:hypothetical protein
MSSERRGYGLRNYSSISLEGLMKTTKKPESKYSISRARFESSTFQVQALSVTCTAGEDLSLHMNYLRFSHMCFYVITPCTSLKSIRRFGGICRLHLYGRKISQARKHQEAVCKQCLEMEICSSETSVHFQQPA